MRRTLSGSTAILLFVMTATAHAQRPVVGIVSHHSLDSLAQKFPSKPLIRVTGPNKEPIDATKDTVALRPGELLVKETGRIPTLDRTLATPHFDLPEGITAVRAIGGSATFTIAFEPQGLAYSPDGTFVGTVHIGLNDSLRPDSTLKLASPVQILLSSPTGDAEFDNTDIQVSHTNLPFTPVRVHARDVGQDSIHLVIRASSGRDFPFAVVLLRPALTIRPSPSRIAGFGLEQTSLTVEVPNIGSGNRTVALSSGKSTPAQGVLAIAVGGDGSTTLRSKSTGVDTIWARSAPFKPAMTIVTYDFPVLFLLAAIFGGALGALARVLGFKTGMKKGTEQAYGMSVVGGIVLGLIVAVAYAIGVRLVSVAVPLGFGEAGAFTAAALGVYFGVQLPGGVMSRALHPKRA
jgi:hypothetical protein